MSRLFGYTVATHHDTGPLELRVGRAMRLYHEMLPEPRPAPVDTLLCRYIDGFGEIGHSFRRRKEARSMLEVAIRPGDFLLLLNVERIFAGQQEMVRELKRLWKQDIKVIVGDYKLRITSGIIEALDKFANFKRDRKKAIELPKIV